MTNMLKAGPHNNYFYNPKLASLARQNRRSMTKSAACMWKYVLGNKNMMGYQFRRERPIMNFIADFVCLELMLIIEVDGWTHGDEISIERDKKRDIELAHIGFTTLRFSSWEVLNRITDVSELISAWINTNSRISPVGPRKREG